MSHNRKVTGLMPVGPERYVTPTTSLLKRKLIEACTAHIIAHTSLTQVAPILFSSPGENWWMRGITNEGPCVHSSVVLLPLHLIVLFPACLCVVCSGPLVCVANAWTGPGRSQVTGGYEPHLSSLVLTTKAVVPQRWLSTCRDGWRLLLALKRGM